jgi:ferredoxin
MKLPYMTAVFAAAVFAAVLAAFAGVPYAGWIARVQAVPAALAAFVSPSGWTDAAAFAFVLAVTLLFGRFYCKALCPLGIAQSFVNWLYRRDAAPRRVCTRLPRTRGQKIVNAVFLVLFFALPFWVLDPYAIFGRMVTLFLPVGALGFLILLAAAFGDGRIWCNWVCPVGTALAVLSRFSVFRDKVGAGCGNCRRCFKTLPSPAVPEREAGTTRRGVLKGVAAAAVAEKLTDGGYAPVSLPGLPARKAQVMPPGAFKRREFETKCVACGLCVANCPEHALVMSTGLSDFGRPRLDFRRGYCRMSCTGCGEVCPTGAIRRLQEQMRGHVHMGHAIWKKDRCVRATVKDQCTACIRKCPVRAIHLVAGFPVVDKAVCIGCGACEHVCPARPLPAIFVKGFDEQRFVLPMDETELVAEMRRLVEGPYAVVLARDGVITARERGRGIAPVMKLLDEGRLEGVTLFDKVMGRAAAAAAVVGKVRSVHALVMSEGAKKLLETNGVKAQGVKTVAAIRNRENTGICPMDSAVRDISDPVKMVEALRKVMKK